MARYNFVKMDRDEYAKQLIAKNRKRLFDLYKEIELNEQKNG